MATAYVYFGKPLNPDTAVSLTAACKILMVEKDNNGNRAYNKIELTISSPGGDIAAAFGAYNELKALDIEIECHNGGHVDSSAIMLMMAGTVRTAAHMSSFHFHQVGWNFGSQGYLPDYSITDASRWLSTYKEMMIETIHAETHVPKKRIQQLMTDGTSLRAEAARQLGLVGQIRQAHIPWDSRVQWA